MASLVSLDPGNLKTDLYRNTPWWQKIIFNSMLKPPINGANVELFAGFSPDVTIKENGAFNEF
jgi:retinol dehydrogenase-12